MIEPLSQTAKAFRDTTVSRSAGEWLRRVCTLYGLPYSGEVPIDDWRDGAQIMAYGARGVPGTTLAWLEAILESWEYKVDCEYNSTNPNRLVAVTGGANNPAFLSDHIGRWVRLESDGRLFRVEGLTGSDADCTPVATSYWTVPGFTNATLQSDVATVLPFLIYERGGGPGQSLGYPGLVEILTYVQNILPPATYLQPGAGSPPAPSSVTGDATYNGGSMDPVPNASPLIGAEARAGGQPYGGHLQADELEGGDDGGNGPFPIYLSSGKVLSNTAKVLEAQLASGISAVIKDGLVG